MWEGNGILEWKAFSLRSGQCGGSVKVAGEGGKEEFLSKLS